MLANSEGNRTEARAAVDALEPAEPRKRYPRDREAGRAVRSIMSVLLGSAAAYGTFAVAGGVVTAALGPSTTQRDLTNSDWSSHEAVAGAALGGVLLVAYLAGGYVAGRLARSGGRWHGLAVGVVNVAVGLAAGYRSADIPNAPGSRRNLETIGMPTSWADWSRVAIVSAGVAVAAVLVGAFLGGALGGRGQRRTIEEQQSDLGAAHFVAVPVAADDPTGAAGADVLTDLDGAPEALSAEAWRREADERRATLLGPPS